ncbi:MAG: hypothetical protein HDT42_09660 [Ruminococcaceae bacterium]|nr:hypothetical protein [Oscillospiraceae bacterium]
MPKQTLTVGDIKEIEKFLELQQNATDDTAIKDKIDELIKKLDEMEIRS